MGKQFTDEEVEWAARCLYGAAPINWYVCGRSPLDIARAALEGGYVPPPRPVPVPVREQLIEFVRGVDWNGAWLADALLAKFDVTPKVQP